ncbi:hypothetical protein HFO89_33745 [Rhizobium leguminosarum]|nr:hypothetical protein [Rhizobium leguminosarum]
MRSGAIETLRLIGLQQRHGALRNNLLVGKRLDGRLDRAPTAGRVTVLFEAFWTLILHVSTPSILFDCLSAANDWQISRASLATGMTAAHYTEA